MTFAVAAYNQGKVTFDKTREQDVAVIKMRDDESHDESFSCMEGQERPYLRDNIKKNLQDLNILLTITRTFLRSSDGAEMKCSLTGCDQSGYICFLISCIFNLNDNLHPAAFTQKSDTFGPAAALYLYCSLCHKVRLDYLR